MLPFMMQLELNDILFFVASIKNPTMSFDISEYVTFCSGSTRSSVGFKLVHSFSRNNKIKHFYFHRLPRLWNSLPTININQSVRLIKRKLQSFLWNHFIDHFDPNNPCSFHFICPCAKCSVLPIKYIFWSYYCSLIFIHMAASVCISRLSVHFIYFNVLSSVIIYCTVL